MRRGLRRLAVAAAPFAAGIAIGLLAVGSIAGNVLCPFLVRMVHPIRIGDEVRFLPDPIGGTVGNFHLLYTTLRTSEGWLFQVPNNMFFQRAVQRRAGRSSIELNEQLPLAEDAKV